MKVFIFFWKFTFQINWSFFYILLNKDILVENWAFGVGRRRMHGVGTLIFYFDSSDDSI